MSPTRPADELPDDVMRMRRYNTARPHHGRGMNGRTPGRAFLDRIPANDNQQEDNNQDIGQTEAA